MAKDYNEEGIDFLNNGELEKAAEAFNAAIETSPRDPVGYVNFGNLLQSVGETDKALRFLTKRLNWIPLRVLPIMGRVLVFTKRSGTKRLLNNLSKRLTHS
ncbi:hypothetical protein [Litoribacterium kuwaitense]|uniref:hypothetical protein n=1 Tax=Litoribacterium kuwaitense TaxID=1398745 RepID=UPI0035E44AF4